jgi:hypothetical protein
MTESTPKQSAKRVRIFPEIVITSEKLARQKALDKDSIEAHKKVLAKYPNKDNFVFCLNETGVSGTI